MMQHIISSLIRVGTLAYYRQHSAAAFLAALLALPAALRAGDGDSTLRYYLSKSPLVVSGEIVEGPFGIRGGSPSLIYYGFKLKVNLALKGSVDEREIPVNFKHPEYGSADELATMRKNARVIVFLRRPVEGRGEGSGWIAVDPWFAVQPASGILERALMRLVAVSKSEPESEPVEVGESGNATLQYYKSKASLVVSGEASEISAPTYRNDSTCSRNVRVKVSRIMRGGVQGDEVTTSVVRFEDKASKPAFLKAGNRVILFLRERKGEPRYETVDPWFGVQQYNTSMEAALDEVWADN